MWSHYPAGLPASVRAKGKSIRGLCSDRPAAGVASFPSSAPRALVPTKGRHILAMPGRVRRVRHKGTCAAHRVAIAGITVVQRHTEWCRVGQTPPIGLPRQAADSTAPLTVRLPGSDRGGSTPIVLEPVDRSKDGH